MIKAEDLRVGDLMYVNHSPILPEESVCTIDSIYATTSFKSNVIMKAKELMIGDWVECVDSTHKKKVYAQIDAIEEGQTCILVRLDNCNWFLDISFIKPIPLTQKILEKNGFVLKSEDVGAFGVNIVPYYTRDDVPFEVFCDGEPFAIWFKDPVNIAFVHELQHTLRLCGIEKEIEL